MIWEFGVLMSTDFSSSHVRLDALNFVVVGELYTLAESSSVLSNSYLPASSTSSLSMGSGTGTWM